jgi:hypothetical protein
LAAGAKQTARRLRRSANVARMFGAKGSVSIAGMAG